MKKEPKKKQNIKTNSKVWDLEDLTEKQNFISLFSFDFLKKPIVSQESKTEYCNHTSSLTEQEASVKKDP